MAFFDRTRTGELINRLSVDTAVVGRSLTDNLSDGLRSVAQAVAGVSMMVSLTSRLSLRGNDYYKDYGVMIHPSCRIHLYPRFKMTNLNSKHIYIYIYSFCNICHLHHVST